MSVDWNDNRASLAHFNNRNDPVMTFDLGMRNPKPAGDDKMSTALHQPDFTTPVLVYLEPHLDVMGRCYSVRHYSGVARYVIALRAWSPQVLLHEVLHAVIDPLIPDEVGHGYWLLTRHNVINAVEVALAPWSPVPAEPGGLLP